MFKSTGKKGYISGLGLIIYALGSVVLRFTMPEAEIGADLDSSFKLFMEGLGIIGLRAKLDSIEPRKKIRTPTDDAEWEARYGDSRPEK